VICSFPGYDIPPSQDYYLRYEYDPDYMQDEHGEDRLISINVSLRVKVDGF